MPSRTSKSKRKKLKRSRLRKSRNSPKLCEGEECCQFYTKQGKQCERKATYKLDLRSGYSLAGIQLIPSTNCCFSCTQHLKMAVQEKVVKSFNILYPMILRKIAGDEVYRNPEELDRIMNEVGKNKILGQDVYKKIGNYLNEKSMETTGKMSRLGKWFIGE